MRPRNNLVNNFTCSLLIKSREGGVVLECCPDQVSTLLQDT
jgi:hypothetical protein